MLSQNDDQPTLLVTRDAAALTNDPGNRALRQRLCDSAHHFARGILTSRVRSLLPWLQAADLEDLLQGALYRFFRNLIESSEAQRLDIDVSRPLEVQAGYLATMARNCLLDEIRVFRRKARLLPSYLEVQLVASGTNLGRPATDFGELQATVAQLDEAEQQLLQWRLIEEASYEDIGVRLGITAGNARVRFHRALVSLKKRLGAN